MSSLLTLLDSPAASSPVPTTGLALWLDASDASTITKDGSDLVSQWSDKSGKGNHVVQATGTRKPKYIASAVNSKPAIQGRHDGTNASQLTLADNATLDYTQFSAFVVFTRLTDLGVQETLFEKYSATGNLREMRLYIASTDRLTAIGYTSGTSTPATTSSPVTSVALNTAHLADSIYDGANIAARLNGTAGTAGALASVFNGTAALNLFSGDTSAGAPFAGYIAELLFYTRAVTTTERDAIAAYLKSKWGTA